MGGAGGPKALAAGAAGDFVGGVGGVGRDPEHARAEAVPDAP
ncbi:hypothetical protein ACIQBJ_00890 [Kitasatospora sp. NPDC088391]